MNVDYEEVEKNIDEVMDILRQVKQSMYSLNEKNAIKSKLTTDGIKMHVIALRHHWHELPMDFITKLKDDIMKVITIEKEKE